MIHLSKVLNGLLLFAIIFFTFQACQQTQIIPVKEELTLVWSDEFEKNGLANPEKWSYDEGNGCPLPCGCGWGNNEQQYYTSNRSENARVEDGHLIIEARKETYDKNEYTSARLVSKNKGDWTYGRIEIKAKIPGGVGVWPAIWMLPTENKYGIWPKSGEIDIMEHVGYEADSIYGTVHTEHYNGMIGTQKSGQFFSETAEDQFHIYSIQWNKNSIDWFVDGKKYNHYENTNKGFEDWPFDQRFHLILNVAVGGHWGGKHGIADDIWPVSMLVDYVRVYGNSVSGTMVIE